MKLQLTATLIAASFALTPQPAAARPDLVLHFVAGALAYAHCRDRGASERVSLLCGVGAGAGKEALDMAGLGSPQVSDFIATAAGAGFVSIVDRLAERYPGTQPRQHMHTQDPMQPGP